MDLLVENESFVIDNISFYKDEKVAEDMTAEGDWKRRGIYIGPRERVIQMLGFSVQAINTSIHGNPGLTTSTLPSRANSRTSSRSAISTRPWVRARFWSFSSLMTCTEHLLVALASFIPLYCEYKEQKVCCPVQIYPMNS